MWLLISLSEKTVWVFVVSLKAGDLLFWSFGSLLSVDV